jgi:hypothetical protein
MSSSPNLAWMRTMKQEVDEQHLMRDWTENENSMIRTSPKLRRILTNATDELQFAIQVT